MDMALFTISQRSIIKLNLIF